MIEAEVVRHHQDLARWLGSEAQLAHSIGESRRVTAVLTPGRYGVRWLTVHETRLG